MSEINEDLDIAVIGMAGRFPGADNLDEFWQKLKEGVELISRFSDKELIEAGVEPKLLQDPNYVKARGIINDADAFDAYFFDYSPHEAEIIDPQHRLFLEKCWETMEHAGYNAESYEGLIGLFGGVSMNTNLYTYLAERGKPLDAAEGYQLAIGNDKDFLTTRVSYKMNLRGPSLDIQTACSTSMVAITVACQNLLNYSCDMALAGGVSITFPQKQGYLYQDGMILSPDGHCRAFDAKARGTVSGNGAGVVLLKRVSDALADGDTIHAIIKGAAFNNDGARRVGYTAPGVDGQADVIDAAQFMADIDPRLISYVETHGTGTEMGDPIEVSALKQVFSATTSDKQFCALGSVKTNIGHLDAASGIAGFIKTVLALKNKQIPPSLHYEQPNIQIDFTKSPFYVNNKLQDWKSSGPRLAGVSSFGIGGTNVHLILQEAPNIEKKASAKTPFLFVLSAKTPMALDKATQNLAHYLKKDGKMDTGDVAFTLFNGRKHFRQRRFVVGASLADIQNVLEGKDPKRLLGMGHKKSPAEPNIMFLFSGQGAQYVNMGKGLYINEPVFKDVVDKCSEILEPLLDLKITDLIYPLDGDEDNATKKLMETHFTQPALFVIELATAKLWEHYGVKPSAMAGHSIGEYVAAHLAGVFSLKDVLKIVAERGRLMQSMPGGSMLSVDIDVHEIDAYLQPGISLATVNTKGACVLSGPDEKIKQLEEKLQEKNIGSRHLHTSHAFHSDMMTPILASFTAVLESVQRSKPMVGYLSNVTGTWISDSDAVSADYYARHLRNTVRFNDNLNHLLDGPNAILLEVGPGKTLASLAKRHGSFNMTHSALASVRHSQDLIDDKVQFLTTAGRLWLSGVKLELSALFPDKQYQRVPLPTYPFERKRYWLHKSGIQKTMPVQTNNKITDISRWFYTPAWQQVVHPTTSLDKINENGYVFFLGEEIPDFIKNHSGFAFVGTGSGFQEKTHGYFLVSAHNSDDYLRVLGQKGTKVKSIVFIADDKESSLSLFKRFAALGKALIQNHGPNDLYMTVVSRSQYTVIGTEKQNITQGVIGGLIKTLSIERPGLRIRQLDLPAQLDDRGLSIIGHLLTAPQWAGVQALRHARIWKQGFQELNMSGTENVLNSMARPSILITGGTGNLGVLFVEYIASKGAADFTLVSRGTFPDKSKWGLDDGKLDGTTLRKAKLFAATEVNGSSIEFIQADVSSEKEMHRVFGAVKKRLGKIDMVIHAAGLIGESTFQPLLELTAENTESQFKAKVEGFKVLQVLANEFRPRFCLVQSSLSAVLGGLGFAAYAAANAFMSNACEGQEDNTCQWMAIDWDGLDFSMKTKENATQKFSINHSEALACIETIFTNVSSNRLIISSGDLQTRLQAIRLAENTAEQSSKQANTLYDRPNIPTLYVEAETDLQKEILVVWQNLLGIGRIGIHDDFFDLGGNSLMGTQLISRMRDQFKVDVPVKSLFENPTIAGVSELIEQARESTQQQEDVLADMLNKIENMSDKEIQGILKNKKEH